jgi:hypothetical protein
MFLRAHKALALAIRPTTANVARLFSKEAPKKDGKKDDKNAAPAAPVIQETPLDVLAVKWITPTHSSLSPS